MTIMEPAFDGEFPKETKKTIVPKKLPALYQRYFATLIDYVFVFHARILFQFIHRYLMAIQQHHFYL
jgi:hypothetical protein